MITTKVSDTVRGGPAARLSVQLDVLITGHGWHEVGSGVTNSEGRILDFGEPAAAGIYRLMFDVASYTRQSFFPSIAVTFEIHDPEGSFHVPLLLGPFGYTVYRE